MQVLLFNLNAIRNGRINSLCLDKAAVLLVPGSSIGLSGAPISSGNKWKYWEELAIQGMFCDTCQTVMFPLISWNI